MLEGLAAWVLNNYIGEYVENLNTHQLSIGVFQGQVELENLPLKRDALKKLDLPLEVKSGFIGRIQLSIPVKRLKSEPWVITLDKLYLVAGPIQQKQHNEEEEKRQSLATKQLQLKALEDKWKAAEGVQSGGSIWSVTPMFANILENIQLKVKDVHLRYEDDVTIPGTSFACGITIKSLSAQSTDSSWLPKFVSKYHTDMMRKLVDLQEFSAYWDIDAEMIGGLSRSELEDVLQRPMFMSATTGLFKDHEFLLEPVTAQAKMRRNTSDLPLRSANKPRVALDIQLDKIPLSLRENQYRGMVAWMKEFTRHEKRRKWRRLKPMCKVKENPRAWWKYAIDANLHSIHDRNKRKTLDYMLKRCRDNCLYVDAYIDYIAIGTTYMEERLKEHMDEMESEQTFEEIKVLREVGRVKMKNTVISNTQDTAISPGKMSSESSPVTTPLSPEQLPPSDGISPPSPAGGSTSPQQGQGLFQRWFPGWGGWYGGSAPPSLPLSPDDDNDDDGDTPSLHSETDDDQNFEQEVLDILNDTEGNNTLLRRDTVFAQLNFQLESGIFKLLHDTNIGSSVSSGVLLEMECSQISMDFESRPRTNGMKFGISVGGLYLRDKMTTDSIMPVLIAPQQRERSSSHSRQLFTGVLASGLGRVASPLQPVLLGGSSLNMPQDQTLFELIYEKKPAQSKADYRLDIKTKPLDIVYNPTTITRVKDFFTVKKSGLTSMQSEIELAAAAKSRYEAIKKQTEEELKHTLDELLEDDDKIKAKRWNFDLDIAAPQIIIPRDFTEINTTLVVFDLGHLQFQNVTAGIKDEIKTDEDDEDDFVTPSSTPPQVETVSKPEEKDTNTMLSQIFSENLSEAAIKDKIYDKYKLNLSDLQVMVGKAKDNWRYAHTKGTSHMHVVDKFSISLQFDRRLLYTSDPQWPKATIAGTLPSLTLHFNEQKIRALEDCAELVTEPTASSPVVESSSLGDVTLEQTDPDKTDQGMYYSVYQAYKSRTSVTDPDDVHKTKQAVADSVLCLTQFSINQVSLEVQSRGRSIAELQVQGVNANFTMRPFDTSISFSIHSLLVVDALQTFGPDFELLVASHKNLCLDSQSGSMRDSEPNSPRSPHSPQSPGSPAESVKPLSSGTHRPNISIVRAASSALQGLVRSGNTLSPEVVPVISPFSSSVDSRSTGAQSPSDFQPTDMVYPIINTDALIKIEVDIISPNCPTNTSMDETLHIANVQFNNLDFIANQQTLVELVGFFQRVAPSDKRKTHKSKRHQKEETEKQQMTNKKRWELSAEFHRLNVLLMRVEEMEQGRKVATATMSEARVNVTLASSGMEAKGSLGSVQVQNLTQEAIVAGRHQKVLSIGSDLHDLSVSQSASYFRSPDMYRTARDMSMFEESSSDQAFTFSLVQPTGQGDHTPDEQIPEDYTLGSQSRPTPAQGEIVLGLRMASLCYTHSPDFLKEISMCLTEFKDYMANVGSSLKVAATEMAIGLVTQRSDLFAPYSGMSLDGGASRRRPPSMSELALDPSFDSFFQSVEDVTTQEEVSRTVIKLDMTLETPVILLPRKPDSPHVLVIHLGRISVRNFDHPTTSTFNDSTMFHRIEEQDRIYIEVRDMSMYSVDLDKQKLLEQAAQQQAAANTAVGLSTSVFHTPQPGGYIRTNYGIPILHDTILELTIQKMQPLNQFSTHSLDSTPGDNVFDPFPSKDDSADLTSSVLQVNGRLITPLKLALSKDVYEQILQTLDNITPTEDDGPLESPRSDTTIDNSLHRHSLSHISEERDSSVHSSVSALKLDESPLSASSNKDKAAAVKENLMKSDENLILKAYFEMPIFNVKMTGDLGEGEQGLVDLKLEDFKVNFEKADPWSKSIEISIQSLIMEDLLQEKDSKHRYLMVSTQKSPPPKTEDTNLHLSQSCPTAMIDVPVTVLPPSLPSSFHEDNVFGTPPVRMSHHTGKANMSSVIRSKSTSECPCTPPPSPQISRRPSQSDDGRLVHMKVLLVERKCPEFVTKYNSTNRFIDVDFNGLDTTINLQTWVVLLDFLGMGAKVHNTDNYESTNHMPRSASKLVHLAQAGLEGNVC